MLQAGQEKVYRRTDGQRQTIIRPVKDRRIKRGHSYDKRRCASHDVLPHQIY